MCVPVFVDGQRVGRFEVDIPFSQTILKFKVMLDTPAGLEIDEYQVPLTRRHFSMERKHYELSDTSQIVAMLQTNGVPIYSNNIQRNESFDDGSMVYAYRAYETTPAGLEEIFDLDQFVPE